MSIITIQLTTIVSLILNGPRTGTSMGNVKAECVVTDEDNGILEIKNIAVDPQNQGQGLSLIHISMGYQTIWAAVETTAPKKSVVIEKNVLSNPAWIDARCV